MIDQEAWPMRGGMDIVTPQIERARRPYGALLMINYEPRDEGFRRSDGFERFDGRPSPYDPLNPTENGTARRAAITQVPGDPAKPIAVYRYRGSVIAFRQLLASSEIAVYRSTAAGWERLQLQSRVLFRAATGTPPGNGVTVTGETSNATFRVLRTVRIEGDFADDDGATGYFLVDTITGQPQANETLIWAGRTDGDDEVTLLGPPVANGIPAVLGTRAARFEFTTFNFRATKTYEGFYGVSGTGHAFAIQEEAGELIFYPVIPNPTETSVLEHPTHVAAHQNHLFLGYPSGRVTHSSLGEPFLFDAIEGAAEFGLGDETTGFVAGYRDRLLVFARNKTSMLTGTSEQDWHLGTVSDEAGCMAGTAQLLDEPVVYDDRAIRSLSATDDFGDLAIADVSAAIRPFLDTKRARGAQPLMALRSRRKSQYRVFFDDGDVVVLTAMRDRRGALVYVCSLMRYLLANDITLVFDNAVSVEDENGRERIFATGGTLNVTATSYERTPTGYVYELDRGNLFDTTTIPFYVQLPFNDFGNPQLIKAYRKIALEVDTYGETIEGAQFRIGADFDQSERNTPQGRGSFKAVGQASLWDRVEWSRFLWSGTAIRRAEARINGRGRTIAPVIYGAGRVESGAGEEPHIITGITIQFEPRRLVQ